MKWVFVTGGVLSGLGKGVVTASLGVLLADRGLKVNFCKVDPYLNVDAGTLSPTQHGETYVLDDGSECDLDLGHYERFSGRSLDVRSSVTAGQIYETVTRREREGGYLGQTVQVVPHVTNEIMARFVRAAEGFDACLVEIGGTVGDMEAMPFLEAVRRFRRQHRAEVWHVHLVTTVATGGGSQGEVKTKPAQRSVSELNKAGLWPDLILCRGPQDDHSLHKLGGFSDCPVIAVPDVKDVCLLPAIFQRAGVLESFDGEGLPLVPLAGPREPESGSRALLLEKCGRSSASEAGGSSGGRPYLRVGMLGKYHAGTDSYKSVVEAIRHASAGRFLVDLIEIDPDLEGSHLAGGANFSGVVVPGGFGVRGTEGMVRYLGALRQGRRTPTLGLCLGLQLMAIEVARSLCDEPGATSMEFGDGDGAGPFVVAGCTGSASASGGTLRKGGKEVRLVDGFGRLYGAQVPRLAELVTRERFRHRYAITQPWSVRLGRAGFSCLGLSDDGYGLAVPSVFRLEEHPFFVGVQFHPEMTSRPGAPHPLFVRFLEACAGGPAQC